MRLYELPLNVRLEIQNYMLDQMVNIINQINSYPYRQYPLQFKLQNSKNEMDEIVDHVLELVEKEQEKKHLEELKKLW